MSLKLQRLNILLLLITYSDFYTAHVQKCNEVLKLSTDREWLRVGANSRPRVRAATPSQKTWRSLDLLLLLLQSIEPQDMKNSDSSAHIKESQDTSNEGIDQIMVKYKIISVNYELCIVLTRSGNFPKHMYFKTENIF